MSDRLYLATRKGLIALARGRGGWRIERVNFTGDSVTAVLHDARDGALYAALRLGHFGPKLRVSRDGGAHWQDRMEPRFPPSPDNGTETAPAVFQIWALEAGGRGERETLWAGAIPAGLFRSDDGAQSWRLIDSLWNRPDRKEWFGGGYDDAGIHSICVDPRSGERVTIAISCGGVWQSADQGASWDVLGSGLRAAYVPKERAGDPNVQDPHRMVQCAAAPERFWIQHHNGIFVSSDGAAHWRELTEVKPSSFGFTVAVHPQKPDTAWFVPAVKDECRVPVDGRLVVTRTRDGGASCEALGEGLPQRDCFDLVYRHALDVDESGERLAMASTTGNLWISEDQGDTWRCVSNQLPPVHALRFA